jgi:hypothetical protein
MLLNDKLFFPQLYQLNETLFHCTALRCLITDTGSSGTGNRQKFFLKQGKMQYKLKKCGTEM